MSASYQVTMDGLGAVNTLLATCSTEGAKCMRKAINDVVFLAQAEEQAEVQTKFFDPVSYSVKSTYIVKATDSNLTCRISLKDTTTQNTTPNRYLGHNVLGEQRVHTPFERKLISYEILSDDEYVTPGPDADFDSHGNLKRQMLDDVVYAATGSGFIRMSAARTILRRTTRASLYYLSEINGKRSIKRHVTNSTAVQTVFWIIDRPKAYDDVFKFHDKVQAVADEQLGPLFSGYYREAVG